MSNAVATVAFLQGQAWAKAPDGSLRALTVGSVLNADEVLVTAKGSQVQLDFGNGEPVLVNGGLEVAMSRDFSADTATDADEALLSDASVQEALTVLEQGGDLLEELEETAAGNNGGGGPDGNTSFVQLTRILEQTDPQSFSYESPSSETAVREETYGSASINRAPLATDQTLSGNEDEVIRGQIIASDPEGSPITYRLSTAPVNGSVTLDPVTGQFTFTPNPNYNGSDSFVVTVTDNRGKSTTTTITLNIAPVNDAPTTDNLNLITNEDTAISGQVIGQDIDGDTLTYTLTTTPANGTVTIDPATGNFTYTPNENYNGSDSFVVTISDGQGGVTTSTITIGITPVNDAPTSSDQTLATDENTPLNGSIVAADVDGDTLTYAVTTTAAHGTVTIDPVTGNFTYTPNANYNGSDSFVVTISDGNGGTTTSTISIGVNPVNDAPTATNQNLTTDEDTPLNGAIVASDVDGDTLTYTVTTTATNGTVTLDSTTGQFTYTPNANYNGPDSFVVTVSDGNGGTTTSTISIGVNPINDAPTATNQNLTTDEDTPLNGAIVASDVDGDTLTYTVTTTAANGTVTIDSATGQFTYTPNANYNGPDSFVVTVSDGNGGTTTSTISIGVNPVNDAPTATNQNLTTDEDTPLNGAIVASDVDGDSLTYTVTTTATNGTVTLDSTTGQFTYTPNANYNGPDSFVVTVSDGNGGTATSTISIGVNPINDAPTATNQNLTTDEDTPLNGVIVASDVDGDTLTYAVTTTTTNGTVTLDSTTGQFTYTPNANYNGPDSFVVTISDGNGGTTTSTISIGVNPVNDAPTATNQNLTTDEDTPLNGAIVASDVDGDTLTYTVTTTAANGTVTIDSATGQFTYIPNANYNGPDSFVVTISDGNGGTTTSTISIGVNPINDAPTATNQNLTTDEDTPLNGVIVASDVDGDTLTYAVTTTTTNGTVTLDSTTGQFTYTPNANYNGPDSFVVTISDGNGGTTTSTISIGVNPVNDAPTATNQNLTTDEDTPLNGAIVASDVDGDTLSYTVTTTATNGTVTIDSTTGQFTYTPNANYNGPDSFIVTVSDGNGGTTTSTISIGVNPINDAPTATNQNLTTDEDTPLNGAIVASDVDGDTLTYTVTTTSTNGTVTIDSATGQFTYTPNANYNGPDSFVVTISDGKGGTTTSTISIGVNPINDAPTTTNQNLTTDEDTPLNGAIVASDVDGDTLTYGVTTTATNGTVTLDSTTGVFTYTPNANYNGPDSFVVTISDGKGGTTTSTISIGVNPINDAPTTTNQNLTTDEDTPLNGAIVASDVDGDTLTYTVTTTAANGTVTLDSTTGVFTYTPNANYNGPDSFVVTVSDGNGGTTTSTISIGVNPVNDAPTATNQNLTTDEDTPLNGAIVASDVDGDTLSYTVTTTAANGTVTIDSATGQFTYTPNANYNGPDSFVVTVSDGNGGTTTSTISIGVNPVNDAPTATNQNLTTDEDTPLDGAIVASDVDGDTLTYTVTTTATNGTVTLDSITGQFTYTPNANYNGPDSFVVTISDGNGGTTTSTISIGVNPVNDAPETNAVSATGDEDTLVSITLSGSDIDGTVVGFVIKTLPANGVLYTDSTKTTVISAGDLVSGPVYFMPNADWNGSTGFTYASRDNEGLEDPTPASVAITITPVPDDAVLGTGTGTVKEDTPLQTTATGTLTISDPDEGEESFIAQTNVAGLYGNFSINSAGVWTYTLNNSLAAVQALKEGETRPEVFPVSSFDGNTTTVTITVVGTNDGPIATGDSATVNQDAVLTLTPAQLLANDFDIDGDTLSIISVQDGVHGTPSLSGGNVVFTPNAGFHGTASFTYTISDGKDGTSTATVSVTVVKANGLPDAVDDPAGAAPYSIAFGDASASDLWTNLDSKGKVVHIGAFRATGEAGVLYQGTVDGNPNVLGVQGTPRSYSDVPNQIEYHIASGKSESIVLTFNGNLNQASFGVSRLYPGEAGGEIGLWEAYYNGVLVASSTFRLFGTLEHGTFNINTGTIAFNSIRFSALHTNDQTGDGGDYFLTSFAGSGPASINGNLSVIADTSNTINASTLLANDTDPDGDALTITSVQSGVNGTASLVGGNVVFIPTAGYTGAASFTYTVSDGRGGSDTATVNLMVDRANHAPTAVNDVRSTGISTEINMTTASLLVNDSDADGDTFSLISVQNAVNGTVSLVGTNITFTPIPNFEGPASFTYTIRDSQGATSTATVNIGVGAASAPSVVVSKSLVAIAKGTGGTSVKFPITTKLVDTDGSETLSIKVSNVPTGLSFNAGVNLGGGVWQFTEADLPNLMLNLPGSYSNTSGVNLTVQVTSTEMYGGFTASTSTTVNLKAGYTTIDVTTTENGNFTGTSASEFIQGGAGNNVINGGNGNNIIHGGAGNDTLTTGSGSDIIYGGSGDDIINSGSGNDRIYGGAGNDTMRGGDAGENFVDVFVWELGDQGVAGAPAVDTIQFFSTAAAGNNGSGGDVLDLRDLLQGESVGPNNSAGNLADYLHFEISGGNTIIHISHTGGFSADSHSVGASFTSAAETQKIVLEGVNLQTVYGGTTDQHIITQLLNNQKLITD